MNENLLYRIKKGTVSAFVSDEVFMGILVLKGGNALDLAYDISSRGSIDIDFSMKGDFTEEERSRMKYQSESLLNREFRREGLCAFDVNFMEKPKIIDQDLKDFWGGYLVEFKLIETEKFEEYKHDPDKLRRNAFSIGKKGSTKFTVDISKYEYIGKATKRDIDGAIVQVYSPEMLCAEKLRALCQQTDEYMKVVKRNTKRARARDFYDIVNLSDHFSLDKAFQDDENIDLVKLIFEAKKVPLELISKLTKYKDFHREDWESVIQTVDQSIELEPFDYYFDRVIAIFKPLQ